MQPLIVVFEDLHWIDSETQAFLDAFVENLPAARLLLLVNYRPEYQHGWGSKTYYRQVRVDPLAAASAGELLDAMLGADSSTAALKRLLVERTEGNPFFVEESVRTLVESGVLVGGRGAYQLTRTIDTIEIPATAQSILAARIDRLDPDDKRLLQAAAVIGKDFSIALLAEVGEAGDAAALHHGLGRLRAAEFIYQTRLSPEEEYTFKHALTHEVAYASLLHERRRALHALIAETTEKLYPDRLVEHVDRLAHHSVRGELWDKAVDYLRQAGLKAIDRSAHREAIAQLDQALRVVHHQPDSDVMQTLSIDIRFDLWTPLLALGEFNVRLERLQEAEQLAEVLGDMRRLIRAVIFISNTFEHMGRTQDALQSAQRGIQLVDTIDDPGLALLTRHYLGQTQYQAGTYGEAAAHLRGSIAAFRGDQARANLGLGPLPSVLGRFYFGLCLVELGEFDEAATVAAEAVEIAETVDHAWSRVLAYYLVATISVRRGAPETAITIAARSMDICLTNDLRFQFPEVASLYGYVVVCSGRIGDGIPVMERAMEASRAMRRGSQEPLRRAYLSEGYLLADRPEAARDIALGALQLAEQQGQRGQAAWVYRVLGEIAGRYPSLLAEDGKHYYREALARSEALGMRPLVAHCHAGLAKLYRRAGKRIEADGHLRTARAMYREMGMTYWLEKAEAEMAELR